MCSLLTGVAASLRALEPDELGGEDCARLAERVAAVEKLCAVARVRLGARAAACGAHRTRGFAGGPDWLANVSGSSVGQARRELEMVAAVDDTPATKEALLGGDLSLEQAAVITETEAVRPGSETELLEQARRSSLRQLKERARDLRVRAIPPEDLHQRQVEARNVSTWRNDLGNVCFQGELAPEVGVPFVNRLEAETGRVRREAKRHGRDEPWGAHAADAFVRLVAGAGRGRAASADVVVVADLHAMRRGHAHEGEVCHVIGGGPIPVALARELAEDAFLKAVLHDGVAIQAVAHFGRHIKAEVRTALSLGTPPLFEGVTCDEPGCDRRYHLEWDHVDPVANGGPTSYLNLKPRCTPHHVEKTERDREAGLLGSSRWKPAGASPPVGSGG